MSMPTRHAPRLFIAVVATLSLTAGGASTALAAGATNTRPVANPDYAVTDVNAEVRIDVLANDTDADGDTLRVASASAGYPTGSSVRIAEDGTLLYQPGGQPGNSSLSYMVTDGQEQSYGYVTVTVAAVDTPADDAPVAVDDYAEGWNNQPVTIPVLANDIDIDSDTLTVTAVGSMGPGGGTATINPNNTITFTPSSTFPSGGGGTFTYTVSDGKSTDQAYVSVYLRLFDSAGNEAPITNSDYAVTSGTSPVVIDAVANDIDFEGDDLTITQAPVSPPYPGPGPGPTSPGVVINDDGTLTYTPTSWAVSSGRDSFSYTVSDGQGGTATGYVNITIYAVDGPDNDAPVTNSDQAAAWIGVPIVLSPALNDVDIDGGALTVTAISSYLDGATAELHEDGTVTFTATRQGYFGFSYTVSDGEGGTASGYANVEVIGTDSPGNDIPVARYDSMTVIDRAATDVPVLTNDYDLDGNALTVTGLQRYDETPEQAITTPAGGTAEIGAGGTVHYTPPPADPSPMYPQNYDSFWYVVSDGEATSRASVSINLRTSDPAVNEAPITGSSDGAATPQGTAVVIHPLTNDVDPDGDALTIRSANTYNGTVQVVDGGQSLRFQPAAGFSGSVGVSYEVTDGQLTGYGWVDVYVYPVHIPGQNQPPVARSEWISAAYTGSAVTIPVLDNDTDVDGDDLRVSRITQTPSGGTAEISADRRTVLFTAGGTAPSMGAYFGYEISDGHGGTATASASIQVRPRDLAPNDAPVANNDQAVVSQGRTIDIAVLANDTDIDGPSLSVTAVSQMYSSQGTVEITADGQRIRYTPAADSPGYPGSAYFNYTVSDGAGGSAQGSGYVQIIPRDGEGNDAPTARSDSAFVFQGRARAIPVLANDSDFDSPALQIDGVPTQPLHGTAEVQGDTVLYTPAPGYYGWDSFSYRVGDGNLTATAYVSLQVLPVNGPDNDAPFAWDEYTSTDEETPVTVDVVANDVDFEHDTLTVVVEGGPLQGEATVEGGRIRYTPDPGFSGTDSITYRLSDGTSSSQPANLRVWVNRVGSPPDALDQTVITGAGIPVSGNLLADDGPDADPATFSLATGPAHGTAAVDPDGAFTYTPAAGFTGTDDFTFVATDGDGPSAPATVTITVEFRNRPPIAIDSAITGNEDTPLAGQLAATDPDGDVLAYRLVDPAAQGTVTVAPDGTWSYTPPTNYSGPDSFTFVATDGQAASDPATVSITVQPVNDAPLAADDQARTDRNKAVTIAVLVNDSDVEGDSLTVSGTSAPAHGSVEISTGQLVYTPNSGFGGDDRFTYTVSDGHGGETTAGVVVSVGRPAKK